MPFSRFVRAVNIVIGIRSRGCFGCCSKPQVVTAVDEPAKGLRIQGREVRRPSFSEDMWSTSFCEMESSAIHSQRSLSSISTVYHHPFDPQNSVGTGSSTNRDEFVNHGLHLWNQIRHEWVAKKSNQQTQVRGKPRKSWNATYENLLTTNKTFPERMPLSDMVEILVDAWEQEGLYD